MILVVFQPSHAVELEFFGTISMQAEAVSPDVPTDQDYVGFRDAYTRFALKLSHDFDNRNNVFALVEMPFDIANFKVQHTWDQERDVFDPKERLAKIQFNSAKYGSVWAGRGWEPYYNEITYATDHFSSYNTGFASYSALRVDQAIVYSSPDLNGLQFNLMHSHRNGNHKKNGGFDDRNQATVSYSLGGSKLAFGFTDTGGAVNRKLYGFAISQTVENFYFSVKYERHSSNVTDGTVFGHDGSRAVNYYAQYTQGRHSFKGLLADVDNFGGGIVRVGYDYQLSESISLFAEYYSEQTGAAISSERGGYRDTYWAEGGKSVLFGASWSFSKIF